MFDIGDYTMEGFRLGLESLYQPILSSAEAFSSDLKIVPAPSVESLYGNIQYDYESTLGSGGSMGYYSDGMGQGNSETNALLRQQNELLLAILQKPNLGNEDIFDAARSVYSQEAKRNHVSVPDAVWAQLLKSHSYCDIVMILQCGRELPMKKLFVSILSVVMCFMLFGCGGDSENGDAESSQEQIEQKEKEIVKTKSNIYETEELETVELEDIEFLIPKTLLDDMKEDGAWKYYYFDDLMLGTYCEEESKYTNEKFAEDSDSFVNGMITDNDGTILNKEVIELPIGKAIKSSIEITIKEKRYILHSVAFVYNEYI